MAHRYDPGQHWVLIFDRRQRKVKNGVLVKNFVRGQQYADRWERRTRGSAVVVRTVYNTQLKPKRW